MIKEIKKGDRFKCINDYIMNDGDIAFKKGKQYECLEDGKFDSELHREHIMDADEEFNAHFRLISTKIQAGLDVPASCTPTTHDFQNYSKEYLDNMQELQAVCDARSKDEHELESLNDGSMYMEKSYIKTGRIDVDKDLRFDLDPKLIRRFKSGAVRGDNTGRVRPDWISPYAIEEISKVLIENANDFGACNYFLGIDEEACLESMARHIEELKEAILITKDMTKAKAIARSVGFNAVAMLHTMVLKEKRLYKEHFHETELVTVEEAKKSNRFVG